jgi:hypothetical protein
VGTENVKHTKILRNGQKGVQINDIKISTEKEISPAFFCNKTQKSQFRAHK